MIGRMFPLYIFCILFGFACGQMNPADRDGQTYWLKKCDTSKQCGQAECLCGVCLQPCSDNNDCGSREGEARCLQIDSTNDDMVCKIEELPEGVCFGTCSEANDCGSGKRCQSGTCIPEIGQETAKVIEQIIPDLGAQDSTLQGVLSSCMNGLVLARTVSSVEKLDFLFVVDNASSMIHEQAKLRDQLPRWVKILTTGDKTPDDEESDQDFSPITDLHLAVVSTDMGLPTIPIEQNPSPDRCVDIGQDGNFLHYVNREAVDSSWNCEGKEYPLFLEYLNDPPDPPDLAWQRADTTAQDFACIAALGTDGCGFPMPLESALKALWPSDPDHLTDAQKNLNLTFLAGSNGHGDNEHKEFLRGTPYHPTQADQLSLLSILVLTEDQDCSAGANGKLDFLSLDYSGNRMDLSLRCYMDRLNKWGNQYPVQRYIEGFKALRPDLSDLVTFSVIAGIPIGLTEDADGDGWISPSERDDFYQQLFAHPQMQEVVSMEGFNLTRSCASDVDGDGENDTAAVPPIRLAKVAQGFGANGTIRSICESDYTPAIDNIIDIISNRIGGICLEHQLERDKDGLIGCEMTWLMKPTESCDDYPYLSEPPAEEPQTFEDRKICHVRQVPVRNPQADNPTEALERGPETGDDVLTGWYYDDFSADRLRFCKVSNDDTDRQRIAFTLSAGMEGEDEDPPSGIDITITCEEPSADSFEEDRIAQPCRADDDCTEQDSFCYLEENLCLTRCETDRDCMDQIAEPFWICNRNQKIVEETGSPICTLVGCQL